MQLLNSPQIKKLVAIFWRAFKFALVGGSGTLINTGLLALLTEIAHLDYRLSGAIAIETAIINNFIWNSLWTWRDRRSATTGGIFFQFVKYNCTMGLTAFALNWGIMVLLKEQFQVNYQIANLIGIGCVGGANFVLNHFWTFGSQKL